MTFYGGAELILWCANLHKILGALVNDNKALSPEIKFHKFLITTLWYSQFNRNLGQIALLDCKRFSFRVLLLSSLKRYPCCGKSLVIEVIKNSSNISSPPYLNYNSFPLDLSRRKIIVFLENPLEANLILPPSFSSSSIHVHCIWQLRLCGGFIDKFREDLWAHVSMT